MEIAESQVALKARGVIATHAAWFDILTRFASVVCCIKVVTRQASCAVVRSCDTFLTLFSTRRARFGRQSVQEIPKLTSKAPSRITGGTGRDTLTARGISRYQVKSQLTRLTITTVITVETLSNIRALGTHIIHTIIVIPLDASRARSRVLASDAIGDGAAGAVSVGGVVVEERVAGAADG